MAECFVTSIAQACNVVLILLCSPHNFGLSCSRKPKHAMASSPCWAFCNLHDATFTSPTYRASPYTDRNLFSARLSKMKGNAKSKPQILNPKWHALPHPSTNACKATQNPQNYWIFVSSRLAIEFFRNNKLKPIAHSSEACKLNWSGKDSERTTPRCVQRRLPDLAGHVTQ